MGVADTLEGVDDYQHGIRMFCQEGFQLLFQTLMEFFRQDGEEEVSWSIVRQIQQTVLDPGVAVLQTKIENGALLRGEVPELFSLSHTKTDPEGQPGFSHLGRTGQHMKSLG